MFQECSNLILEVEFQGKQLSWNEIKKSVGPMTVGTDYGNCCFFAPQVNFGKNCHFIF